MKTIIVVLLLLITGVLHADVSAIGFWKIVDSREGFTQTIVAVYEYEDALYGRNIVNYDEKTGEFIDTIYDPVLRVKGVIDNPFLTEINLFWGLIRDGVRWKQGRIIDPRNGRIFACELRLQDGLLVLKGRWGPFFRNVTLWRAEESDFPDSFQLPDTTVWKPRVPQRR